MLGYHQQMGMERGTDSAVTTANKAWGRLQMRKQLGMFKRMSQASSVADTDAGTPDTSFADERVSNLSVGEGGQSFSFSADAASPTGGAAWDGLDSPSVAVRHDETDGSPMGVARDGLESAAKRTGVHDGIGI